MHERRQSSHLTLGAIGHRLFGAGLLIAVLLLTPTAHGQSPEANSQSGIQAVEALGGATGRDRYMILYDLKTANRIATGLTVADLNLIVQGMEDQRPKVIRLMSADLLPNLTAADVVALSGQTSGRDRYGILYALKTADRIATGLTVADLNSIVVGMEDQRAKVVDLMVGDLVPNLSGADVVALLGSTTSRDRYGILYDLQSAGKIAPGLTVQELNSIITGMEDQRAKVINLMKEQIAPDLKAADVVSVSGQPAPGSNGLGLVTGYCGSGVLLLAAVPDYVCFNELGETDNQALNCSARQLVGYRAAYFGEGCRVHDQCYGSPGTVKSECDSRFRDLLEAICDETFKEPGWILARSSCRQAAGTYYGAVDRLGCKAFVAAQEKAGHGGAVCR